MKRKLFALTVLLGITVLASWAPRAEAIISCDDCPAADKTQCVCPPESDFHGRIAVCSGWIARCYRP